MPGPLSAPRSVYVASGAHEIHVAEWGDPGRPAIVMWHGLARTGRDFDELASALCDTYFVLCPDTLGRGLSAWARDPKVDYSFASFGEHALAVLDHYGIGALRWVGTSMGALLGMVLAAGRLKGRISHLVVNDIGPVIPDAALERIITYVGSPPQFVTMAGLETWLRTVYEPFGANTETFWRRMTDTSARRTDAGKVTAHYDPAIVEHFRHHRQDFDLWADWDRIGAATLLLRGDNSDVLPADVADEMTRRGPRPRLERFADVGHAPTLASGREIGLLREFLA